MSVNPVVREHYRRQMNQIKARIMSQPRDRVGPLGEVLRETLRRGGGR
jgi:hypothetical protein